MRQKRTEKPFCYCLRLGGDWNKEIEMTASALVSILRYSDEYKDIYPKFWAGRYIYAKFARGREEKYLPLYRLLKKKSLTKIEVNKIKAEADAMIEKDEESPRSSSEEMSEALFTEYLGLPRRDRGAYIRDEIERRSWVWDDDAIAKIKN